jgi:hypothetical protein
MIPRPEFGNYALDDPRLIRLINQQMADNARVDAALAALQIVKQDKSESQPSSEELTVIPVKG